MLVIAPTRELALQTAEVASSAIKSCRLACTCTLLPRCISLTYRCVLTRRVEKKIVTPSSSIIWQAFMVEYQKDPNEDRQELQMH